MPDSPISILFPFGLCRHPHSLNSWECSPCSRHAGNTLVSGVRLHFFMCIHLKEIHHVHGLSPVPSRHQAEVQL